MATLTIGVALIAYPANAAAQTSPDAPSAGSSRLFFAPSGRMLPPGEGYVSFDAIFLTTVQVGVTPRFSMGIGAAPIVRLFEDVHMPMWVTPKFQIYSGGRTSVAAGLVSVFVPGLSGTGGTAYVVSTTGTADRSFTIGGAFSYFRSRTEGGIASPTLIVGAERRVLSRMSVITENWIGMHGGLVTVGLRGHGRRLQGDAGLGLVFAADYVFPAIVANFAVKFGRHAP
jgi:hypothetical protein